MGAIRVVNVGDAKVYERFHRVVQQACIDEGLSPEEASSVSTFVTKILVRDGFVLTRQVSASGD